MKVRFWSLALFSLMGLIAVTLPAAAQQTLYENGPINGENDGWTINFGFVVTDSITIASTSGSATVTGMEFGAWLTPGDTLQSVELSISSQPDEGTFYFDGVVNPTQSSCFVNNYSYDVCLETINFNGPSLNNGLYYVTLQSAMTVDGNPVYWDENDGVGCHSQGCPSYASEGSNEGSIPSESFTILGTTQGGSTPEPGGIVLFASGVIGVAGMLRRKLI